MAPSAPGPVLVNLWGHLSGSFGLGEGARCTARALEAAGLQVRWCDLPLSSHPGDHPLPDRGPEGPALIDLIHTNPNVLRSSDSLGRRLQLQAPLRIGFWAWELEQFPTGWDWGFAGLDQLWCPSAFTAAALGLRSPVPVTALPHLIDWARADRLARQRAWRRRPAVFTVLYAFDGWSTEGRKNPFAVIDAFQMAFPRDGEGAPAARLWLKLSSAGQFPDLAARLRARATADPRIDLIDRHLSPDAFDALYRDADVLLSLHRSEGFGLTLAEAMAAGLPVVATGYSGNLEFMDSDSAQLVPGTPVTIQHSQGDYRRGCRWVDPCVATAAGHLRRLAADPAAARRLAMAGRQAVADRLAPDRLAAIVAERVGSLLRWAGRQELLAALPAGHPLAALQ